MYVLGPWVLTLWMMHLQTSRIQQHTSGTSLMGLIGSLVESLAADGAVSSGGLVPVRIPSFIGTRAVVAEEEGQKNSGTGTSPRR